MRFYLLNLNGVLRVTLFSLHLRHLIIHLSRLNIRLTATTVHRPVETLFNRLDKANSSNGVVVTFFGVLSRELVKITCEDHIFARRMLSWIVFKRKHAYQPKAAYDAYEDRWIKTMPKVLCVGVRPM